MRLRRTLGPIRRQIRTRFDLVVRGHQFPDRAHGGPPLLRRAEEVVKNPLRLHGHGEAGRVAGLPLLVRGRHRGGEPGHPVEAEGPLGGVRRGRYVARPGPQVARPQSAEQVPEFLPVGFDGVRGAGAGVHDDEAGVWAEGVGEREVGAHCGGEEAEVARLGGVFRVHEDVTVLVVLVAGGGVDAEEFLGPRVTCGEDGFHLVVCFALPAVFREVFALGSASVSRLRGGGLFAGRYRLTWS